MNEMQDNADPIQSVGAILTAYMRSGPQADDPARIRAEVLAIVDSAVVSPEESTQSYKDDCEEFLKRVVKAKGMPVRAIASAEQPLPLTGIGLSKNAKLPLQKILVQRDQCVENYRRQSQLYFDQQRDQLSEILTEFLRHVPVGGTKDKSVKHRISQVKKVFRDLSNWDRLFSTIKANAFDKAVDGRFAIEGGAIAAVWNYDQMDERGEFRALYNHRGRDGRVFAVRGNWALEKGLMRVGPDGYIDDVTQPMQDFDCMCGWQWLYTLQDIPESMITPYGQKCLASGREKLQKLLSTGSTNRQHITREKLPRSCSSNRQQARSQRKVRARGKRGGMFKRIIRFLFEA